jgi:ATP-dependent protease HslVU (ClpYQ) peptidase subunit
MKFQHLPIGTQFRFEGKTYTKTGPLVAAAEDGSGQRVIPRYAMLASLGEPVQATTARGSRQIDADKVQTAFACYEADVLRLLETACGDDAGRCDALKAELAEAGQRLRDGL